MFASMASSRLLSYSTSYLFSKSAHTPDTPPATIDWSEIIHAHDVSKIRQYAKTRALDGINTPMSDGVYPLHAAIRLGDVEMAAELLKHQADPLLRDHQKLSAYDYALLSEKRELIELLFPQEAGKALEKAMEKTSHTIVESRHIHEKVVNLEERLRRLMSEHIRNLPSLTGLHKVLADGNLAALKLMGAVDLSQNNHHHGFTPLHLAVLSRNEALVQEILLRISVKDCLAKDSHGLTPLHYAAMYGLANSLDGMLNRVKEDSEFHIDALHPGQGHSLANLAVVAQQPKSLAVLCQHGVDLNFADQEGCSAAHLLAVQVTDKDPLKVSTAQKILACYNLAAIVVGLALPKATWGLMAASLMTSSYLTGNDMRGQALFWAGEILSTAVSTGLQQYPFLKAVVDVWRVASICAPCLYAISRSFQNLNYEGTKALYCATVNGVITGTTLYRARDSLGYLANKVVALKDASWPKQLPWYDTFKQKQLETKEAKLNEREKQLQKQASEQNELKAKIQDRRQRLHHQESEQRELKTQLEKQASEQNELKTKLDDREKQLLNQGSELSKMEKSIKEQERAFSEMSFWQRLFLKKPPEPAKDMPERHITFGTTYLKGNALRDEMSELVNANQGQYAEKWGLTHRVVTDNLLKKQCTVEGERVDCSPYWNKIAVLKGWLESPAAAKGKEEWYVLADDDMAVTNMKIDPFKAIDTLRRGKDTSVIIAEDPIPYDGNKWSSINTGLLFVRKDETARNLINRIWEWRDMPSHSPSTICPTLGYCGQQRSLHEQEALSNILRWDPSLIGRVISVVPPRDTYEGTEIALNTFERSGSFIRKEPGWETDCYDFSGDFDHLDGMWRPGDWMGQTTGVPVWGWYCSDKLNGLPPAPIRKNKLVRMISQVIS